MTVRIKSSQKSIDFKQNTTSMYSRTETSLEPCRKWQILDQLKMAQTSSKLALFQNKNVCCTVI